MDFCDDKLLWTTTCPYWFPKPQSLTQYLKFARHSTFAHQMNTSCQNATRNYCSKFQCHQYRIKLLQQTPSQFPWWLSFHLCDGWQVCAYWQDSPFTLMFSLRRCTNKAETYLSDHIHRFIFLNVWGYPLQILWENRILEKGLEVGMEETSWRNETQTILSPSLSQSTLGLLLYQSTWDWGIFNEEKFAFWQFKSLGVHDQGVGVGQKLSWCSIIW